MTRALTVGILFCDLTAHHVSQVYLKSWTGTNRGSPPTSGGGGAGLLVVPFASASTHINLVLFLLFLHDYFHNKSLLIIRRTPDENRTCEERCCTAALA